MENMEPQLPKTNAEWVIYYDSILNELTDKVGAKPVLGRQ